MNQKCICVDRHIRKKISEKMLFQIMKANELSVLDWDTLFEVCSVDPENIIKCKRDKP